MVINKVVFNKNSLVDGKYMVEYSGYTLPTNNHLIYLDPYTGLTLVNVVIDCDVFMIVNQIGTGGTITHLGSSGQLLCDSMHL